MNTLRRNSRTADAVQLRDAAIKLTETYGNKWPDTPVTGFQFGGLLVWHTVFPLLHWIDIWEDDRRKVLNIQWNDSGVDIISFRRGDWESKLLKKTEDGRRQQAA